MQIAWRCGESRARSTGLISALECVVGGVEGTESSRVCAGTCQIASVRLHKVIEAAKRDRTNESASADVARATRSNNTHLSSLAGADGEAKTCFLQMRESERSARAPHSRIKHRPQLPTHFSPPATLGNDANKSLCLGNGLSVK